MFELGQVVGTPGVIEAIGSYDFFTALNRHKSGDWGLVCEEDSIQNDKSVELGYRILSVYESSNGIKYWIITEADRSSTTVLLPSEY